MHLQAYIFVSDKVPVDISRTNNGAAIRNAIVAGNLAEVKRLLRRTNTKNPVISYGDTAGYRGRPAGGFDNPVTALEFSAQEGKLDIYRGISAELTNINPGSRSGSMKGRTPMHAASNNGHLHIVKYISNCLFDKNPKTINNASPLHSAAWSGQLEVVRYLTNFNRNLDQKTNSFWNFGTPVQFAADNGHTDVLNFLNSKRG